MISWLWVALAILFEVSGTTCMKLSDRFQHTVPSILMFVFYALSLASLTMVLGRGINVSVVYAVWSGLGTALIAIVGFIAFRETATPWKLASLALIILGIVGLHLGGGSRSAEASALSADHPLDVKTLEIPADSLESPAPLELPAAAIDAATVVRP